MSGGEAYDLGLEGGLVVVVLLLCGLVGVAGEDFDEDAVAAVLDRFDERYSEVTDAVAPAGREGEASARGTSRCFVLNRRQRIPRFFSGRSIFSRQGL